jgi:urease accessory protein
MATAAVAKGGAAIATVLIVPGDDAVVAAIRAMQEQFSSEVGVSAWHGIAAVRLVAHDGAALRRDLIRVMTAVRELPRIWTN